MGGIRCVLGCPGGVLGVGVPDVSSRHLRSVLGCLRGVLE